MNDYLAFWRTWNKQEKVLLTLSTLIGLTLLACCFYLREPIHWDVYSELKEKLISPSPFFIGDTAFAGTDIVYYVNERYGISIHSAPSYVYQISMAGICIGLCFALIAMSRMSSMGFFIGIALLAALLISFHTETLFGFKNQTLFLIAFFTLGGLVFYFNSYRKYLSSSTLFVIFGIIILLFLIGILLSKTPFPVASMVSYAGIFLLLLLLLFIFFTSHEAYMAVVWLISNNAQKGKNNLAPFAIISIIFIFNLFLIYLENANQIDENKFLISSLILFAINTVLGFWGFRKYLDQTQNFSHQRVGIWLYTGVAIIVLSFLALILFLGNDTWIELFEDMVAISSLVMSIVFFIHILVNFKAVLKEGHMFHKVIYKPIFSRLIFARVAALFGIIVLFLFKSDYPYRQWMAGHANSMAEYFYLAGDNAMAETYFKHSANFDIFNQKANTGLAQLAMKADDKQNTAYYFNQILQKKPLNYAYIGLSRNLESEDMYFDAVFTLQQGLRNLPNDPYLLTNMAYLQRKSNQRDSVFLNLQKALENCRACDTEKANMVSFWIENAKKNVLMEKVNSIKDSKSDSYLANVTAARLISLENTDYAELKDSILNVSQLAFMHNQFSNPKLSGGRARVNFQKWKQNNEAYEEILAYAEAKHQYYTQSKTEGLKQMAVLGTRNVKNKNLYMQTYAMWLSREGAINKAILALKAANDTLAYAQLQKVSLKPAILRSQSAQAEMLIKNVGLTNYQDILNKAPLNPFLIHDIAGFLIKKNKTSEAYNVLYYGMEPADDSPMLLMDFIEVSGKLGQAEYAQEVLTKYRHSLSNDEYRKMLLKLQELQQSKEVF